MEENGSDLAENGSNLAEMLRVLTPDQLRYVAARADSHTDQEALRRTGIKPGALYRWKRDAPIDEVVRLIAQDSVLVAREKLRRAAAEAVDALLDDLDARRHSKIRQDAAKDVLDRLGMKTAQHVELTGKDGGPQEHVTYSLADWRKEAEQRRQQAAESLAVFEDGDA